MRVEAAFTTEEIHDDRLRIGRPADLQADLLPTGPDRDPERQERAALALQIGQIICYSNVGRCPTVWITSSVLS
jgi:hypothetical protein